MTAEARAKLSTGQLVRVRTRHWLVEDVQPSPAGSWLQLACVDDDAQGDSLEVIWEAELDGEVLDGEAWAKIGHKGFDDRRHFAAYFNTLRWHCVTATDPKLFQAPFRAGIRIDAYQLEPLRKALLLPRVNLFIADDVGLGKTIEAGLIATELLLRRRVRDVVVACPPSMLKQWQDELDARFGLRFEILDRDYVERIRRERGYAVNPWDTFPRFLISQRLLIDETYAAPMRVWLDNLRPGSLLILDEAHHAAPASGAKYAIDSKITRAIRDLGPRFEHRLFLSATPHNGHSNSFSALLELLDDKRFMRGVPVLKSALDAVMVRRLKEDVRAVAGGFPIRRVVQVDLKNLPAEAPELRLAELLDAYSTVRRDRFAEATKREQTQGALILSTLQQRLFSSVEAFQRTLGAHRRAMEKVWSGEARARASVSGSDVAQMTAGFDNDDERGQLPSEQQESEAASALEHATASLVGAPALANTARERQLLADMARLAEEHRYRPDARVAWLIEWLRTNCCPGIRLPGGASPQPDAVWSPLRLILFTEYEDTARYLRTQLEAAIAGTDRAEERIEVFHGPTPPEKREDIKRAFMTPPERHPVRILIATDAAREGINLQAHCWNLFHYDLPWNPSRLEQRNGRIDRKLQPNKEVFCHYFVYTQRPEDRVLRALVRKTETIRLELGSLSEVIEKRLRTGIRRAEVDATAAEIEGLEENPEKRAAREAELDEAAQERQTRLRAEVATLSNRIEDARKWIGLDEIQLRDSLNCSLDFLQTEPLREAPTPKGQPTRYEFTNLQARHGNDPRWAATLDTLRPPPEHDQSLYQWRREAPLRPVVFAPPPGFDGDTVQLHLSHRVVQRLLGRFLAQGFVYHDLSRACLAQSEDAIARVVLLGRLALYGGGAVRLHEELVTVTARWMPPADRKTPLTPYARDAEARTMGILQESLKLDGNSKPVPEAARQRLQAGLSQDVSELLPHLEQRGKTAREEAEKQLNERGKVEAESLKRILEDQRRRVLMKYRATEAEQLVLHFSDDEKRQLAADRRHWERWLANVDGDLTREPKRIAEFYEPRSFRLEPVGLAYLWPVSK
ncbi:MAG TPA: DISARM system SNF2-like helicase DrmD [Terriglobia bacterium]|nr:DISARM system SNF2-like helicase DrmD [Terriglobia bacterium]